jgi:hypothetical protein
MVGLFTFASEWDKSVNEGRVLYTTDGMPVCEGDIIVDGRSSKFKLALACQDLGLYEIFNNLVSADEWVGRKIVSLETINGSSLVFSRGLSDASGAICCIKFDDGKIGALFTKGITLINPFEKRDVPDFNLLIKAGMFTENDNDERIKELAHYKSLADNIVSLAKERRALQESFLLSDKRDRRDVYNNIINIEAGLLRLKKEKESRSWKWAGRVFDLDYMVNWKPDLADFFDQKDNPCSRGQRTNNMTSFYGKKIVAVHKIFDSGNLESCEEPNRSSDVYSVEFEDGIFSVGIAFCTKSINEIPIDSLLDVNIITKSQYDDVVNKLGVKRNLYDRSVINRERLSELKKDLEEFGLSKNKLTNILTEIELLEN